MMYLVVERQDSTCPCLDLPLLFIAFACNAKSCAIVILFCFLVLLPRTDFGRIAKFFLTLLYHCNQGSIAGRFNKKHSFHFLKSIYSFHRRITRRRRRSCPSFTAYLYAYKTIEDCTGAEEAGIELASKANRISYTGKTRWEMPHQLWLIKTLPRLSQTKQNTTR